MDVAGQIAWAYYYFSALLGATDAALRDTALSLYQSHDESVNYWIRPGGPAAGLPAFRTAPWRKWAWEHRVSDGLAFALGNESDFALDERISGTFFDPLQDGHGWIVQAIDSTAGPRVVVSWYTYLGGQQRWLFGSGPIAGNRARIPLQIASNGQFPPNFNAASVAIEAWGEALLEFSDPDRGSVSWTTRYAGYNDGSMPLRRLTVPASGGESESAVGRIGACHSGTWFAAGQSGHGFFVEVSGPPSTRRMTLAWYAYLDRQQRWMIGNGPVIGDSASLDLITTRGGGFPPAFDPAQVVRDPWGSLRFIAIDANRARVQWSSVQAGFGSGELDLVRLTGMLGRSCR